MNDLLLCIYEQQWKVWNIYLMPEELAQQIKEENKNADVCWSVCNWLERLLKAKEKKIHSLILNSPKQLEYAWWVFNWCLLNEFHTIKCWKATDRKLLSHRLVVGIYWIQNVSMEGLALYESSVSILHLFSAIFITLLTSLKSSILSIIVSLFWTGFNTLEILSRVLF